jgi:SAM-dependent methyltransferase
MTHPKAIDVTGIMRDIRERVKQSKTSVQPAGAHLRSLSAVSVLEDARAGLAELQTAVAHIDDLPPQPPTMRGSIGAALSRIVKRLLFWQYTQARGMHASLIRAIEPLIVTTEHVLTMSSRTEHMDASIRAASGKVQRLANHAEALEAALRLQTDQRQRLEAALSDATAQIRSLQGEVATLSQRANETLQSVAAVRGDVQSAHRDTARVANEQSGLAEQIADLERNALLTRRYIILQEQRITSLLTAVQSRPVSTSPQNSVHAITGEVDESIASIYVAFEDAFRGGSASVVERLRVYLPILAAGGVTSNSDTVIDIGCGRGEWLELLLGNGYVGIGCDSNEWMVNACRERGLNAVKEDGVHFLNSLEEGSVAAITAFHVVEHLPTSKLLALIDGSLRVLRPGGMLILETPNPSNMLVASHNFYLDPTHQKPVPLQLLQFLVEARGFFDVRPLMLHPYPDSMALQDVSEVAKRFNEYFYGPQDYAIVAKRP